MRERERQRKTEIAGKKEEKRGKCRQGNNSCPNEEGGVASAVCFLFVCLSKLNTDNGFVLALHHGMRSCMFTHSCFNIS